MNQIIVHCGETYTEVALLENHMLVEYYVERPEGGILVGNVYKGRVVNVLPGMQAAFVDIGLSRNAFLYIDDLLDPHLEKQPKIKPSITALVREGQELIVQVAKEPLGSKGARVTTHYALPGRSLVYMPYADYVGVSRKVGGDAERGRLKTIAEDIRLAGEGVILRTAAETASQEQLEVDLVFLRNLWLSIDKRADQRSTPGEIYCEVDIVPRLVRDAFNSHVDEMLIDEPSKSKEVLDLLQHMAPELMNRVKLIEPAVTKSILQSIEHEFDKYAERKIHLTHGGYIVIDPTEALTAIDVNTGRYIGTDSLEETVFLTNLEAAEQIARILRLRDIGGIILVDFIDMQQQEHKNEVLHRLESIMRKDRSKHHVVGWTRLGLMEITRKRVREHPNHRLETCSFCKGTGKVIARNRK